MHGAGKNAAKTDRGREREERNPPRSLHKSDDLVPVLRGSRRCSAGDRLRSWDLTALENSGIEVGEWKSVRGMEGERRNRIA